MPIIRITTRHDGKPGNHGIFQQAAELLGCTRQHVFQVNQKPRKSRRVAEVLKYYQQHGTLPPRPQ